MGRNVHILSDSQAALKALNSPVIRSNLVLNCLQVLKNLSSKCNLTLIWVPGHQGIEGNEIADGLAKTGAELPFTGPEPCFGFGPSNFKELLNEWVTKKKSSFSLTSLELYV